MAGKAQKKERAALKLEGDMTIARAGELKKALLGALEKSKELEVDMEGVTGVDVSCLQVLLSARKSARAGKKSFRLCGVSGQVKNMIRDFGCGLDAAAEGKGGKACFYIS
jgi:anti-anti-sigma factor